VHKKTPRRCFFVYSIYMIEKKISNLNQLEALAKECVSSMKKAPTAQLLFLKGDLGSGKTAFAKKIAHVLGIQETVTSPTFVVMKEYQETNHSWIQRLVHIDAYRLNNKSELEYLKWDSYLRDPHTLILVEWPEMVEGVDQGSAARTLSFQLSENQKERAIQIT